MADFALWAAACETALGPAGTFGPAYYANRRSAIQGIVDVDPVAACVREIMAERSSWTGSAGDLLRTVASRSNDGASHNIAGWPKNPPALAGRLRRAQTFLRVLGIEITLHSVVKAEQEPELSRYVRRLKIPSAPSAALGTMGWVSTSCARAALALASHDFATIEKTCNKILWLDHGVIKHFGPPDAVLEEYRNLHVHAGERIDETANPVPLMPFHKPARAAR
jgi:hypothetical protein